jgi:hypothetical protein
LPLRAGARDAVNPAKITTFPLSTLNSHSAAETFDKCTGITDDRAIFLLPSNFLPVPPDNK